MKISYDIETYPGHKFIAVDEEGYLLATLVISDTSDEDQQYSTNGVAGRSLRGRSFYLKPRCEFDAATRATVRCDESVQKAQLNVS